MTALLVLSLVAAVATGVGASKGQESMARYHKVATVVFVCCVVLHVAVKIVAKVI